MTPNSHDNCTEMGKISHGKEPFLYGIFQHSITLLGVSQPLLFHVQTILMENKRFFLEQSIFNVVFFFFRLQL